MNTLGHPTLLKTVLKLVNQARVARGEKRLRKIPKGRKAQPLSCPIANALDGGQVEVHPRFVLGPRSIIKACADAWGFQAQRVGGLGGPPPTLADGDIWWTKLPFELTDFVWDFDAGRLPEYDEDEEAA